MTTQQTNASSQVARQGLIIVETTIAALNAFLLETESTLASNEDLHLSLSVLILEAFLIYDTQRCKGTLY